MRRILVSIMMAFAFASCEDKVDIDVPVGEERIVVDGFFSNLENSEIVLSKSSPYFQEGKTPRLTGVTAYITSEEGDSIALIESPIFEGSYIANQKGEIGKTYTLHLILPDGSSFTSIPEKMNRVPEIDSIYSLSAEEFDDPFADEGYLVLIETVEPKGVGDYYRWMSRVNGELQTEPSDLLYASDELVDGNFISEFDIVDELEVGDEVQILQMSISERAFNYLALIDQQTNQVGGPFDAPPSPIKSNVLNDKKGDLDALGYFMVSGIATAQTVVTE